MKAGRELDALVAQKVKPYKCRKCGGTTYFVYKDGRRSCTSCAKDQRKRWRKNNPDKCKAMQARWKIANPGKLLSASHRWKLKHLYGMTECHYEALYVKQDGKCLICLKKPTRKLTVDHCHSTGKIRGLLCNNCNRSLGWMGDNIQTLDRAKKYLMGEL